MNRSPIEWLMNRLCKFGFTWNCIHGCRHGCVYCYACRFAKRLAGRGSYPKEDPFQPVFDYDELTKCKWPKEPSRIFVASMGDLFGDWGWLPFENGKFLPKEMKLESHYTISLVVNEMYKHPEHTFLILTKNPAGILSYEANKMYPPIPPNVWLGVSVDTCEGLKRLELLGQVKHANKFVSFEPLLGDVAANPMFNLDGIRWAIVGAQTGPGKVFAQSEWVVKIMSYCNEHDIPVFLKDNLNWPTKHQDFPGEFP